LGRELEIDVIEEVAQKTINLPMPDLTFILDIDPLQAQARLSKRKIKTGEHNSFDALKLEFHQKVRENYLKLKKLFPERILVIDAEKNENELLEEVQKIIQKVKTSKEKDLPKLVRVVIANEKNEVLVVKDGK
jgi:dTMP kinase